MPRGDYRKRESKKPKKEARKIVAATVLATPATVEVVKPKRKERSEEEEG